MISIATFFTIAWSQSNYELSTSRYNERNNEIIIKGNVTEMEMDDGDRIIYINDKAVKIGEYTTHENSQEDWENEKEVYNKIDKYDYVEIYESDRIMCNGRTVYEGEPKPTLIQYYIGFGILTGFLSILFTVIIFFSLRWIYEEYLEDMNITIRKKKHKKQDKIDALESKITKLENEKIVEKIRQTDKSIILCSKCNAKNQNDALYCSICGNILKTLNNKDDYYWHGKKRVNDPSQPWVQETPKMEYPKQHKTFHEPLMVHQIPHNLPAWKIPDINKPRNFCPNCVHYSLMHHTYHHYKCTNCGTRYNKK